MAVNYDDVIRRNKRNLTRAQIRALSKAANRFSAENAGNRAGALSQLKEQYDTGYRGLQNMGLAGGVSAQATSGEVPRLGGKIETAFDQYNQKLNDVEHQRLKALGGAYAKATRRARYEAYKRRLAAEAARRAALEAAMREAKANQEKSASMHQTPVEARGLSGSTITSDIRRQRNVNMTDTGTGDSGKQQAPVYTSKKEAIAAAAKAQKEAQERREAAYGASADYQRQEQMALRRYQNAADRAAREKQHAYDVAAAELVGVSMPKQPENVQTAATNLKAAEARAQQDNGDMTGRVKGPSFKTQAQLDARQEVKNAEETLRQSKVVGYDTVADKQAYEAAQKKFEQAERAYNSAGKSPVAKPGQVASMTDSGSEQRGREFLNEARNAASSAASKEYEQAKQERDAAKLKYEQPKLYAAYVVAENPDASPEAREAAAKELMKSWGYAPDERTQEQFTTDKKTAAKYSRALSLIDDPEPDNQAAGERMLKSLGVTEEEARKFVSGHRLARGNNAEYDYYKNALMNQLTYAGKAPIKHINEREQDPLYRAINNLSTGKRDYSNANFSDEAYDQDADWANGNFSEGLPDPDVTTGEEYVANELRYLTDDERNAYNYIYETKGLQAANQYIRDGLPIRNIRAAADDQAYAEKLVQDHPVAANLLSIASNSLANVPAMVEKLVKGTYNFVAGDTKLFIDTNNSMHRLADMGNKIQSETSRKILEANPGTSGKIYNFTYQTGMSMAQSAAAMLAASTFGTGLTDIMFFSSAGNEAYKDAIERGGTQEQALGMAFLSGFAESLFEHASIENFLNLDYQGKGRLIKNMLSQAGVEASEEVNTELANILADALVMKDKSEYNLAVKKYMDNSMGRGMSEEAAKKKALLDQAKNVFMAGVGGLASGLGFGVFGAVPNAISQVKTGKEVKAGGYVDSYIRNANLLGGDAAKLAQEVNDSYKVDTKGDKLKKAEPSNRLVGALAQQVNRQMLDIAGESAEKGAAVQTLLTGDKLTTNGAKTVLDALGAETLGDMGYDTSSASALAKSYNAKLEKYNVTPRMQETSNARQLAQAIPDRRNAKTAEFTGAAQEQQQSWSNADQNKVTAARADAANRVWANPTQGLSFTSEAGQTVTPMPGNMTAISFAEQERTKFKPRASATTGNVTYAVAGMQAREGLSNEQTLAEIKKGLTKEARAKANVYEKLSSALGVKMVIHDVMVGTNGFIDENGNMHVVLSGKQSVLRVAAHELTHWSKENNRAAYDSMREHLIKEVGQERFDRMLKQKAREYGIDLSTDKGKTLADDEVCAELCERMLSNEEALERFAEKDTKAAKTLKDHLVKILNAIKAAFKNASNRDFGESWSDLITEQETIESWIDMLQGAVEKADGRAQTTEGQIAQTAGVTSVDEKSFIEDMNSALFMDEESASKMERGEQADIDATKGTSVPDVKKAEMEGILSKAVLGNQSNYGKEEYKQARSMLAQLVPQTIAAMNGDADLVETQARIETAIGKMFDNYFEADSDAYGLRDEIPDVIAVDTTANSDLKHQDTNLFTMSSKISKALGKRVTLIGPANAQYKVAEKLEDLWGRLRDQFGLSEYQDFSIDVSKFLDFADSYASGISFDKLFGDQRESMIKAKAIEFVDAVDQMLRKRADEVIAEHSVDVFEYDLPGYVEDLKAHGITKSDLTTLVDTINKAIDKVKMHRDILDFGQKELETDLDIIEAKKGRAYLPYKQNADPHYRLALDFSTLCRKRTLLQAIQERLQEKLKRSLSPEEQITIRNKIIEYRTKGEQVEVACALCYVEAARLKSPKVINEFLGVGLSDEERRQHVGEEMRNYFAQKDADLRSNIKEAQDKWKRENLPGFTKTDKKGNVLGAEKATKKEIEAYGREHGNSKLRDLFDKFSKNTRQNATVNAEQEQIIKDAEDLVLNHTEDFLSAKSLAEMKMSHPDIFYAFVNKVRSATRSKAQETDTFYSRGDIDMVDDATFKYANAESGFRHQSWSDFVPGHVLDTIGAIIEMSTRDAKMHAYTKVPAMIELLGNTGMMMNMSLIPVSTKTGLAKSGELKDSFDSYEGMDWATMQALRDKFPNTAGNIAIGVSDEQIEKLLQSPDIDYVIPYHASGLNQTMRGHMGIQHWLNYTDSQNETHASKEWEAKHKKSKEKPPALAAWFSEKDAKAAGKNGVAYMQKAAQKYLDICKDKGWVPKFSQYLDEDATGYHPKAGYENYWKLLIDRKMVNHITGEVIIQQAVKPNFEQATVMKILDDAVTDPANEAKLRVENAIVDELSKTWVADRDNADLKAKKEKKQMSEVGAVIAADFARDEVIGNLKKAANYSLDTDAAREAFTHIDTTALENGLEALKGVTPGKGLWAIKDISRFMDSVSGGNKELRDNLTKIFETPHRQALKNYATGVGEMQKKVLDIGQRAGVCDAKGNHFDSKKSAAIQNIGEGFSNRHTDVSVRVVDSDAVRVTATDKETGKPLGTKDYTFRELRGAYGREVADQLWSDAFDAAQKEGKHVDVEREVNTQPYTLQDLKEAYPQDWQKLKAAADEFRTMYDDYIRDINGMLETIYPYASKYATVDKITEAIEKKQQRLADRKAAYNTQIENLQKSLEEKEKEIASKKRTDTKAYRQLVEQANRLNTQIADAKAEIAEYEANIKDELTVMGEEKALMMNAEREGDSLGRMHRLEYRSDYFHHFTEMASGIQNLKSIFTGNTDISPAVVGKSDTTKPKSRFAGFFQQRQGGSYTADALNGMLRYGQLAEYKLAFDPFAAYLRDVEKQVANLDKNETNRDNLIRYIQQWTNTILGKSHTLDRALVDSGVGMRSKLFKTLNWINSRVIQNTLLWNMRSALIQISNVTNAKSIVTNNLDWANGLRKWALARRGNSEMQSIMNQSTFLASRYMDSLELTESKLKSAKQFAGWLLGALDEVSAKATWWAAYTQYQRNPNAAVIKNAYRTYDNAIDYADDVTRRTHAGRGVGELAPAMTSRVMNLVAPFQVEVNNTYQLLKDNVKQKNYLGLLSTGISVFALNTVFEAIVGSTPLGFDFIRAIVDIAFGIAGDDPDDDDDDYSVGKAAQRLAGEFVGGLPYANQIVGLIGKDNAEKIIGSDTDVTRYGNTQIGLNALMNTVAGISDIGSAVKEGKNLFTETNFISDIDDLLNIIMPMGGKQLTRTAEGLITMAKGYSGKVDKEGSEKVQFIADNNIVNWLHAGLFGKWALTQASEYFGDERLLPKLFGAYEGPKSATGKLVDAKQYKAALDIGIDGKEFFTLKDGLKKYTTQGGKRAEMMQQKFTPEQKAKLDALLFAGSGTELKAEGALVYQKSGDEWKVKADYSNQDMFDLSKAGDKTYTGTIEAMEKTGLPQDQAALAADMWSQAKTADDSKAAFRDLLKDNKNLTVAQKEALDLQYCGNKYAADYSDPDLYELSTTNRDLYEKAKTAKSNGVSVKTYTGLYNKAKSYEGDGKAAYMRNEIMNSNLTTKQKELMDDMLVSDKGRNPDYSSKAWFEISMISESQYKKAKEGEKVGVKPETYLAAYKKRKELNAKDKNGKYINSKKKARALFKKYLNGLAITAPAHDYLWSILK